MKVAILGCGSLGGVMAARLAGQPDIDLTVIDSDPSITGSIRRDGLILRQGKKKSTHSIRLVDEAGAASWDVMILATKAIGLAETVEKLKEHTAPGACMVTVQNGLVALDLAEMLGNDRLVPGCVLWGASMEAPGVYRITNSGSFILGGLGGRDSEAAVAGAADVLRRIFPLRVSPNIRGVLWSKLAIAASFTPLGAITGLAFGKLAASRAVRRIILAIGRELFEVGRAEGVTFEPLGGGLDIQRFLSDRGYSPLLKHTLIRIIGHRHRRDESSMLDSIRRGRKTELQFINERLVLGAERNEVPAPYNRLVVKLIREMERGERRPGLDNLAAFGALQ
jgi:2-dehydropantoate 2-reductase